ncbi:hypothetical protein JYK14_13040 [Siccirubricoccus sp. KC 17139]|uniref:Uncharacterized protein n=1 Tax=Siccirubricoccus soli TaxID=2899147 RepID=A0ABT1D5E1_9PROT|nr:hypothetical protein [Siccirubricoccus soli]MCO6417079.1 hypothetical protein [Siccirubricoccus soli]MCP2683214.1 hypothetical protein [Siccirubricoccus soli]
MDYRIDHQAISDIAKLATQLPTLQAPIPPHLAALEQRLSMIPSGQALGVPAGCYPTLPPDLLRRLMSMVLPPIPLLNGVPMLGVLANLRFLVAVRLGFPIPHSMQLLAALMEKLDLSALSLIARMPWGPLNGLHMLMNIGALLRARLNIVPSQFDASLRIQENLPKALPGFGAPLPPPYMVPNLMGILRYLLNVRMLLSIAEMMGVNLTAPGAIPHFSAQLRMLLSVRLPVLAVMPSLLPNLYLLARINAIWRIADIAVNMPAFRAHIAAILRLNVPPIPYCMGPQQVANLANMPPALPTPETVEQMMNTDLSEIAKVDWKIPDKLPIQDAIPGLNALALLQDMGPILVQSGMLGGGSPAVKPPAIPGQPNPSLTLPNF